MTLYTFGAHVGAKSATGLGLLVQSGLNIPCLILENAAGAVSRLILALLLLCLSSTCQLGATRLGISFYAHSKFVLVLQLVYMLQ